jgi:hypothetical protein
MLLSGGANILGQLSQEGNEGDINLLSAGLGALTGAMTAPDATNYFNMRGELAGEGTGLISKAKEFGFNTLGKGSEILRPGGEIPSLFSKEGAKAALLPASTATGDVMQAEARQLEKQAAIDDALAAAELIEDSGARAQAIRNAMLSYGFFTDEEIDSTISSAGYRAGGRVGLELGGGLGMLARGMQDRKGESEDLDLMTIKATLNQVYTNNDDGERGGYEAVMEFMEKNPEYEVKVMENIIGDQGNKIMVAPIEKIPVNILDGMNTDGMSLKDGILVIDSGMLENKAKGGRVGAEEGGIMKAKRGLVNESGGYAGELAGPLDNKIEGFGKKMVDEFLQGNYPEFKGERVSDSYNRPNFTDVDAVIKIIEMGGDFDDVRNVLKIDISDERIKDFIRFDQEDRARKEGSMKDGGLMNLGGKEMDLRGGGFVPIGKKERADDVPARLSKNEFVMTADAVRAAGGGSVNKGAKRMYDLMNNLEARV